jgi:predicted dienelactone hydrolase
VPTTSRFTSILAKVALATALVTGSVVGGAAAATGAQAADNPYERGPTPTLSSIQATQGPFATTSFDISGLSARGYGGATVYYPTSTSSGTFGVVAIAPGFTAYRSSLSWLAGRLATFGFVVVNIDTNSTFDQPASRGDQLLAALDQVNGDSRVSSRIDTGREAVMGHSMGGGGTLEAAADRPSLQAAVPLTPWDTRTNFSASRVPTLIIGGQADTIAPVAQHSIPFYTSLNATYEKAYLELAGASHFAPNSSNTTIAEFALSWLKRYVDNDTRFDQFLCPHIATSSISQYRDTCPNS